MHEQKYKDLRQNLDKNGYPEHLNPDSADLVKKLLGDHLRLIDTYSKLKKKSTETSKNDTASLQHQLDLLNEKYGRAIEENERLRRQMADESGSEHKIANLEASLKSCMVKYEKKVDELTDKVTHYENQIEQMTFENRSLRDEIDRVRSIQAKSKNQNDSTTTELTNLLDKKKKQIQKLEQENAKYRAQVSSLQRIYNQERQSKSTSQVQVQKKSALTMQVLKQELIDVQEKLSAVKRQLEQQREVNQQLRQKIRVLNQKNNKLRNQQDLAKNSYHLENNAKNKYQVMYADSQNKIEELKDRVSHLDNIKSEQQNQVQRLNQKIKDLANKNKTILGNISKVNQQITVMNENYTNKVRECRDLEHSRLILQNKIKDLESTIEGLEQRKTHNSHDASYNKIAEEYEKKLVVLEKQLQITHNQMKMIQENQQVILTEKSKLETEIKKLQMILAQGNQEMEKVQSRKEELMKQNKELKAMLSSTKNQQYTKSSEVIRTRETLSQYEIMVQDFKARLRDQQTINKALNQKLSQFEKALEQQTDNNRRVFQDNKQLKLLVTSLEKTKADLFEKYKTTSELKAMKQDDRIEYMKEYQNLLEERRRDAEIIRSKDVALSTLSHEYDQLQNLVDEKTLENQDLLRQIKQMHKQAAVYGKDIGQREMSLQNQLSHLKTLQRQLQKCQNLLNIKCEQLNECQLALNRRTLDAQELNNQLLIVVNTNKQQEKAAERQRIKMIDLEKKLKDRLNEIDSYRQAASSARIQNQALTEQITREKDQFRKLETYCNEVVEQYQKVYDIVTQRDRHLAQMEEAVNQLTFERNQHLSEINHFEKQIRTLNQEMIRKQEELQRLAHDRDVYRAEVNTSRRSLHNSSTDWKSLLEDKIQNLQNDYNIKKRQCETLKIDVRKLQKVVEAEREKVFCLEQQLRRSKTNDPSNTPIKVFYKSRVQSQNWNGYNRDIVDLENSIEVDKLSKYSRNSNGITESFQSEKASLSSKECEAKLNQIMRQYNETIIVNKFKK